MKETLTRIELYSREITDLINEIDELTTKKDLFLENFKANFLELSTNN